MQTMFALTEQKSRIMQMPNALSLVVSPSQAHISFQNVQFGYVDDKPPILNGISFDVPTGKKVALVGGSGSGKSTIVRLLYRLYDAQQGEIEINGQNIGSVELDRFIDKTI